MVAWEDYRNVDAGAGSDVYARDMTSTPGPETLIAGGNGDQGQPAVSDRYIVWVDNSAIRARPCSGGNVINFATGNGDKLDPAVCGSLVVWQAWQTTGIDILGVDLSTGTPFTVTNDSGNQTDISGTLVAWEDDS